jgi:WD40 repeat protein
VPGSGPEGSFEGLVVKQMTRRLRNRGSSARRAMSAWVGVAGLLAGVMAAIVAGGPAVAGPGGAPAAAAAPASAPTTIPAGPAASQPAEKDLPADPLPAGAVARFGWARLHHGGWVRGLAFSPDSRILASCGGQYNQGGDACLWDVATGRLIRVIPGPAQGVAAVSFSADSKTLVTAGQDQTVGFWNAATGKAAEGLSAGNVRGHWVVYAPDGKTVAITNGAELWLVNPADGKTIRTIPQGASCSFSADSRRLAVVGMQAQAMGVELWDAAGGTRLRAMELEGGPQQRMQRFVQPAISADGKLIAAGVMFGTERGVAYVWDAETGKIFKKLTGLGNFVNSLAMGPDGKFLAASCRMGMVYIWDIQAGKQIKELPAVQFGPEVVAFSPDGKLLAAGGQNGQIYIWSVPGFTGLYSESGHSGTVRAASASRDGRWVATAGEDGTARFWDGLTGRQVFRLEGAGVKYLTVAVSPDGSALATACNDDTVRFWETPAGKGGRTVKVAAGASGLAYLPRGDGLIAVGQSLTTTTIDPATGAAHSTGEELKTPGAGLPALSGDGSVMAVFDRGPVLAWDIPTGRSRGTFTMPGVTYASALALDYTGRLVAADMGQKIVLAEMDSGRVTGELALSRTQTGMGRLAFSPDASVLAACDVNGTISLWALPKGEKLDERKGHRGTITALRFTQDGKRLLSGGADGTAILWRVDDLKKSELSDEAKPFAADPKKGWDELASLDGTKAQQAILGLTAAGEAAVKVLQERMESVQGPPPEQIAKLIDELGAGQFAVRNRACDSLGRLGPLAETALRRAAAAETCGEEVRARAQQLLSALDDPLQRSGDMVRQLRAVFVLERIALPQAREVLRKLAAGAPQATLTRRAAAALERMPQDRAGGPTMPPRSGG